MRDGEDFSSRQLLHNFIHAWISRHSNKRPGDAGDDNLPLILPGSNVNLVGRVGQSQVKYRLSPRMLSGSRTGLRWHARARSVSYLSDPLALAHFSDVSCFCLERGSSRPLSAAAEIGHSLSHSWVRTESALGGMRPTGAAMMRRAKPLVARASSAQIFTNPAQDSRSHHRKNEGTIPLIARKWAPENACMSVRHRQSSQTHTVDSAGWLATHRITDALVPLMVCQPD